MYLVAFRVVSKILVGTITTTICSFFLLFNIISEIIIIDSRGLILVPGADPRPPLVTPLVYIYISHKKDRPP